MELLVTVVAFLLIFGLLIFVHELGHFLVARRNGIKVEEFAFGLPLLPAIYKKTKGETTYSIYPVPLGGFVRMLGEDGASRSKRSFASKSAGVRAKVLLAGVTMNLLLAYILLTVGFLFNMQPVALCAKDYAGAKFENKVNIAAVSKEGSAQAAGLKEGDQISRINGETVNCQREVPQKLRKHPGAQVSIDIVRDGQPQTINLSPGAKGTASAGKVGIAPMDKYERLDYPIWGAPYYAAIETVAITKETISALGGVFLNLFTNATVPEGVTGPVGIAKLTGEVVTLGAVIIIRFVAILSLSLAIFNLLPIPALDGGRLLFVGIEALRGGKPVTPRIENAIHAGGFALLILFIAIVTYFDITRGL